MLSPSDLQRIRRIQIKTKKLVNTLFSGLYASTFKGRGIQFEDLREYQPGDEIRDIDWPVTARMNKPFVKTFSEERQLSIVFIVDVSASTHFGTRLRKSEWIAEVAAVLAFSAIQNQDKVGLLLFSDEVELYLPPEKGVKHVLRVIRELLYFQPKSKKTALAAAFDFLAGIKKSEGVFFLFSDFLFPAVSKPSFIPFLKNREVIAFGVQDSLESRIPPIEALLRVEDLETGTQALVDVKSSSFQQQFPKQSTELLQSHRSIFEKHGTDFVLLKSDASYVPQLNHFFAKRALRR